MADGISHIVINAFCKASGNLVEEPDMRIEKHLHTLTVIKSGPAVAGGRTGNHCHLNFLFHIPNKKFHFTKVILKTLTIFVSLSNKAFSVPISFFSHFGRDGG